MLAAAPTHRRQHKLYRRGICFRTAADEHKSSQFCAPFLHNMYYYIAAESPRSCCHESWVALVPLFAYSVFLLKKTKRTPAGRAAQRQEQNSKRNTRRFSAHRAAKKKKKTPVGGGARRQKKHFSNNFPTTISAPPRSAPWARCRGRTVHLTGALAISRCPLHQW